MRPRWRCGCTAATRWATRWPRPRSRWPPASTLTAVAAGLRSRPGPPAGGGWRSPPARTASSSINDAYNANPDSVAGGAAGAGRDGRDRRPGASPLGGARRDARAGRGRPRPSTPGSARRRQRLGVDRLVAVGPGARPYLDGDPAGRRPRRPGAAGGAAAAGSATAVRRSASGCRVRAGGCGRARPRWPCCAAELGPGDVVLVKASRAIGLDRLAAQLLVGDAGPAGGASRDHGRPGGGGLAAVRAVRHAAVHPVPGPPRVRAVHPRRRADVAPHQARHADDGRRGDDRLGRRRLRDRPRAHPAPTVHRPASAVDVRRSWCCS